MGGEVSLAYLQLMDVDAKALYKVILDCMKYSLLAEWGRCHRQSRPSVSPIRGDAGGRGVQGLTQLTAESIGTHRKQNHRKNS
jgi:hypothetical protein